jgi:membrane protease YdiL (CAAX protease family)
VLGYAAGLSLNRGQLPAIFAAATALPTTESLARVGLGALLPLFTAALPEEIFFRGILQTRLEATVGRAAAIVLTPVLFTAWHLPPRYLLAHGVEGRAGDLGSVLLGTGVPVLIIGMLFGLAWDRYRNLPTLIAAHWGIDTLPAVRSLLGSGF